MKSAPQQNKSLARNSNTFIQAKNAGTFFGAMRQPVQKRETPTNDEEQDTTLSNDNIQLKSAAAGVEDDNPYNTNAPLVGLDNVPAQQKETSSGSNKLPLAIQTKMENAFGTDFSDVNIHKNSEKAKDMGALAYAQGIDLHFAPGQFKLDTPGQKLIGHELAHVVQQKQGRVKATKQMGGQGVNDDPQLEKEADDMGNKAATTVQMKLNNPQSFMIGSNTPIQSLLEPSLEKETDELGKKAIKGETTKNQIADGNGTYISNNAPIQKQDDDGPCEVNNYQILNESGYVIAPNGIRLHTTPNLDDPDVVAARISTTGTPADNIYPLNSMVEVIGVTDEWLYIRTSDQNQGWISDQHIDRSSEFEGEQINQTGTVVADDGIRLQQIPVRTTTREDTTINLGTEITILKHGNERASSWSLIRTAGGNQGWIESVYIKTYEQIREEIQTYLSENSVFEPDITSMDQVLTGMHASIQLRIPPRFFNLIIRQVFRIDDISNELTSPSDAPRAIRPGFLRLVLDGWKGSVSFPYVGQYTYTVNITIQNIGSVSLSHQFNVVTIQDRADAVLEDQPDLAFQDLTTDLNAQLGLLAPENRPSDTIQSHISIISGSNPAAQSDPSSPNHVNYTLHNPGEGVSYQWFVKPLEQNELPDSIGEYSIVSRENGSMYALGEGNSKSWPTSRAGTYVVICEPSQNDETQQPITFLQTILLNEEQVDQVTKLQGSLTKINNEYAPQLREQVPVTAVHIDKRTGASTSLSLYIGHASNGNGFKMMDLTPGLDPSNVEIIYEGDTVSKVLADFDSNNKYPEGRISLRIPENDAGITRVTQNIETDGASFFSSLSSGFGWAALGLGVAALIAAPFTGGSSLIVTALILGSTTAGVAAGTLSIMDRLQNEELDTVGVTIDLLGIAADLLTAGMAGNGLRAGRQAINVAGRNMRYLLYSNFVVEGASFTLISIQGIGQIQNVMSSDMSENEKRAAIVRILAALAATGALLVISSRDLTTTNARLNGHISRDILDSISNEQRLILDLLDESALTRLRVASREDIDGLIRTLSDNPTIARQINNGIIPDDILAALARNQDAATMLRLRRLFGSSIEDIDELVTATRQRMEARLSNNDNFELQYSDAELGEIISQGRTLGLSQEAIEDLIFTGSRNNKRLTSSQLINQMDNWVNDIAPRGFPHLFNTMEEFNTFKQRITGLLESYGISSNDIRIQGSSLRTSSAEDIDIAVFLSAADFDAVATTAREGYIARLRLNNHTEEDIHKRIKPIDKQIANGRLNSYYFDRIPNSDVFNDALYEIRNSFGFKIDISLMRPGSGFDIEPFLRF